MTGPIELDEYGSAVVRLSQETVERLAQIAGSAITTTPTVERGVWELRASSWVGTVVVGELHLLIRPKVTAANLFHMLEAGGRSVGVRSELFAYQRTGDLLPAFATFYASVLERSLARGLPKEYVAQNDRLVALRGRVDIKQQLRVGLPVPVACAFDEHTADVQVNRIARGAAEVLLRLPGVSVATRQTLSRLVAQLEEASGRRPTDLATGTAFTRLNAHFESADRLARLILTGSSITNRSGSESASTFLVNMNTVFESYVEHRLRRTLKGRLDLTGQLQTHLDHGRHVGIRPDLVFKRGRSVVYVGDAKYKLTASGFGREADYYQLLAYASALDVPEGVLVYCQNDGTAPPQQVEVRNAEKRLHTRALTLAGGPSDLDAEIERLADWIVDRVGRTTLAEPDARRSAQEGRGPVEEWAISTGSLPDG